MSEAAGLVRVREGPRVRVGGGGLRLVLVLLRPRSEDL
jgi:hypothetical protein